MTVLTEISHPLIGYALLAPRPHANQAVPPTRVPETPISPPVAPASVADLRYREEVDTGNILEFRHGSSSAGDLRYRDGTTL